MERGKTKKDEVRDEQVRHFKVRLERLSCVGSHGPVSASTGKTAVPWGLHRRLLSRLLQQCGT